MTAAAMIAAAGADSYARLKWRVLRYLGICPASLRARLLGRRRVLHMAGQIVLDADAAGVGTVRDMNPNFDMTRFQKCLAGS